MDYNSLPNFYAALDAKYNVTNNELNSATYTNVDCNFVYSAKYARHRWFNYKEGFSPILVEKMQTQLDNANAQLKTAQDGLKAFDGVDVAGLQEQVTKLKADMKAQAEGFAFDNALNAAIMSKKGRSVKAVRALLDLDALKGSADRSTDIAKALDEAAKANPWAFGEDGAAGVAVVSTGAEHGAPPANDSDGVEAAFKSLNPELNL